MAPRATRRSAASVRRVRRATHWARAAGTHSGAHAAFPSGSPPRETPPRQLSRALRPVPPTPPRRTTSRPPRRCIRVERHRSRHPDHPVSVTASVRRARSGLRRPVPRQRPSGCSHHPPRPSHADAASAPPCPAAPAPGGPGARPSSTNGPNPPSATSGSEAGTARAEGFPSSGAGTLPDRPRPAPATAPDPPVTPRCACATSAVQRPRSYVGRHRG
ncbi:hypothetical protein D9M70_362950 [compost metagenome]